jgi:membrane protein YdbS with pleckstrin-like domain
MFADLIRLINRRPPADYERGFVRGVSVHQRAPRNRRVERLIAICWVLIVLKSFAVVWLFNRYHVPVNPLWVIAPTVVFAALCTVIYLLRD